MRVLDLFSGIGGFSLGLERAGMTTVAFCEIEEYPRRVLAKHWLGVPIYEDVRTLTADTLSRDGIAVDVICGGFPCQDISLAGKRAGIEGERSGLWGEYRRLIGELQPKFVIVENVSGIISAGAGRVLGDLAALGYDCLWECIPASSVGAPHRRDRWWCIAYSNKSRLEGRQREGVSECSCKRTSGKGRPSMADTARKLPHRSGASGQAWGQEFANGGEAQRGNFWITEPDVGRVAHGVPKRVDRLKGLGNAVVPQIPEMIGRAIMAAST